MVCLAHQQRTCGHRWLQGEIERTEELLPGFEDLEKEKKRGGGGGGGKRKAEAGDDGAAAPAAKVRPGLGRVCPASARACSTSAVPCWQES